MNMFEEDLNPKKIDAKEYFAKQDRDFKDGVQIMDTGILNEIMDAYAWKAMERAGIDENKRFEVIRKMHGVYDDFTASEILEDYRK